MISTALLVSPSAAAGGAERALVSLAKHLPTLGVTPTAILLEDGPLRTWLEDVNCFTTVVDSGRLRDVRRTLGTIRQLRRLSQGVGIVISNMSTGHIYGGVSALCAGTPEIWWQQGDPQRGLIERLASFIPTGAIVCSNRTAAFNQRRLTPTRRVEVIHLGTDIQEIRRHRGAGLAIRETQGWSGHPVIGIVGRLQPWKGQDTFLRAARTVSLKYADVRYAVIGGAILGSEGSYPEQLEALARELGIADLTTFTGHQDNVYAWCDALDVVVHASLAEPFGLVLVEAMALGKPLVATLGGGPSEIVEDEISGILVPHGDDQRLAATIVRLLSDADLMTALGEAAQARAAKFTEQEMTSRFARLIQEVTTTEYTGLHLEERTVGGLHNFVMEVVRSRARAGTRAVDLGTGSGALAVRLRDIGYSVVGCDADETRFAADVPFLRLDLDSPRFADELGAGEFDLVTALEVIEHVEAPISFLRNIARLLSPGGLAVVTTPNVDSLPARVKFLVKGKLRLLDDHGDPTHISPIFRDLLLRQYLPRAGLCVQDHETYPPRGFVSGRPTYRHLMRLLIPFLPSDPCLVGDNHVLVLRRIPSADRSEATHALGF